jgi:hypothetical protein
MRNKNLKFLMGNNIENLINLFLVNVSFKNAKKLIKVKTLAPFYTQKISMSLSDLVFEENSIISLIIYHVKGGMVNKFGILS